MGRGASYYLNQVMLVVANSDKLQNCTPRSIFTAAMNAATLRLSVDPKQGQAWIIPYKNVATFQMGYKGVYELAMRTNLYRFINVPAVFADEELIEDRMTGMHTIVKRVNPLPENARIFVDHRGNQVIAYMLYFKLLNGFEKTFVMSINEIERHAQTYAPKAYNDPDSAWNRNNGREREKMLMKTVLKNGLSQWGRFNQGDKETLEQIESEQTWTESDTNDNFSVQPPDDEDEGQPAVPLSATPEQIAASWPPDAKMSYESAAAIKSRDGFAYTSFNVEELEAVYQNIVAEIKKNGHTPERRTELEFKRDAAQLIQNAIIKANQEKP